jgi:hypothetical protein
MRKSVGGMDIFGSPFLAIIATKYFRLCDIPQQLERKNVKSYPMKTEWIF